MTRFLLINSAIISIIIIGCTQKTNESVLQEHVQLDTTIYLFDIKQFSRQELSMYIEKINALEPSVIGINVSLPLPKDHKGDSAFQQSIVHSGRVVLCATIKDDNDIVHSNPCFLQSALDEGVISYLIDEDGAIRSYQPLFDGKHKQMSSFPDMIAYHYDPRTLSKFEKFEIDEIIPVQYIKQLGNFKILNADSIASYKLKGKIVIFDDLTPSEFKRTIPDAEGKLRKVPSAVITANVILNRIGVK